MFCWYQEGMMKLMNKNDVLTDPAQLVRLELKNAGYDMNCIPVSYTHLRAHETSV